MSNSQQSTMYSSVENPIEIKSSSIVVPPQARINNPNKFNEYVGIDYVPIGIFHNKGVSDKWFVHANADNTYTGESIRESFPTQESAFDYAEKQYSQQSHRYRYIVLIENESISDIEYGHRWMEYRVIPSQVNDGWVHGFHGDHDHNKGGPKEKIIEGAKEAVIENGYNRLLIENKDGSIENIWPNCFLVKPPSPFKGQYHQQEAE